MSWNSTYPGAFEFIPYPEPVYLTDVMGRCTSCQRHVQSSGGCPCHFTREVLVTRVFMVTVAELVPFPSWQSTTHSGQVTVCVGNTAKS